MVNPAPPIQRWHSGSAAWPLGRLFSSGWAVVVCVGPDAGPECPAKLYFASARVCWRHSQKRNFEAFVSSIQVTCGVCLQPHFFSLSLSLSLSSSHPDTDRSARSISVDLSATPMSTFDGIVQGKSPLSRYIRESNLTCSRIPLHPK